MPYDLPFERISTTDNISALGFNKLLATALTNAFPEIYNLNAVDSGACFTQFEIDPEDEFPERYFRLWANIGEMHIGFQFWKDTLWLELGTARNTDIRFGYVRKYAAFLLNQGFKISISPTGEAVSFAEGIEWHLQEYRK
jgi:hypothetical protein